MTTSSRRRPIRAVPHSLPAYAIITVSPRSSAFCQRLRTSRPPRALPRPNGRLEYRLAEVVEHLLGQSGFAAFAHNRRLDETFDPRGFAGTQSFAFNPPRSEAGEDVDRRSEDPFDDQLRAPVA